MVATRARSRAASPSKQSEGEGPKATTKANGGRKRSSAAGESNSEELNPLSFRLWNAAFVALLLAWPWLLLSQLEADAFRWESGPSSGSGSSSGSSTSSSRGSSRGSNARHYVVEQALLAVAGFLGVVQMVRVMGDYCRRKGQTGRDLCKRGTAAGELDIPESQGLAPGIIYMVVIIVCQLLYSQTPESLANYNSSLLSICFMLFLGFVDDVLVRACLRACTGTGARCTMLCHLSLSLCDSVRIAHTDVTSGSLRTDSPDDQFNPPSTPVKTKCRTSRGGTSSSCRPSPPRPSSAPTAAAPASSFRSPCAAGSGVRATPGACCVCVYVSGGEDRSSIASRLQGACLTMNETHFVPTNTSFSFSPFHAPTAAPRPWGACWATL
jgi:hypothetical protein